MTTAIVAPICPVHRKPMNQGNRNWYCPAKVGVGLPGANAKGYCTQAMEFSAFAPPPPPGAPAAPAPVVSNGHPDPLPAFPSDAQVAAAALDFAAKLYAPQMGQALTMQEELSAIACAVSAFRAMKQVLA